MFKKELLDLEEKGFIELWRNDNSIYLMNKKLKMGVMLMNKFSFKSKETSITIELFDEFKKTASFLEKKTFAFINEIQVEDKEDWETDEEFRERAYNDQYFFLKMPLHYVDYISPDKYNLNIDFLSLSYDEYENWFANIVYNEDIFIIDPFERYEWIVISDIYRFISENAEGRETLYIAIPPSIYSEVMYIKYILENMITWKITYTWNKD